MFSLLEDEETSNNLVAGCLEKDELQLETSDNLVAVCLEEHQIQLRKRTRFNRYTERMFSLVDFVYRDLTMTFLLVTNIMLISMGAIII